MWTCSSAYACIMYVASILYRVPDDQLEYFTSIHPKKTVEGCRDGMLETIKL